eukprot:513861-Hanusia_phi.AAC.2
MIGSSGIGLSGVRSEARPGGRGTGAPGNGSLLLRGTVTVQPVFKKHGLGPEPLNEAAGPGLRGRARFSSLSEGKSKRASARSLCHLSDHGAGE